MLVEAGHDIQRFDYTLGDELEITVENKRPDRPDYEVFVQVNNLSSGKGVSLTYIQPLIRSLD